MLVYPLNTELFLLYISQINFAKEQFKDNKKEWVLLVCIGASSGVGRLTFGKIGDVIPGLKKIYMQVRDPTAAPFPPDNVTVSVGFFARDRPQSCGLAAHTVSVGGDRLFVPSEQGRNEKHIAVVAEPW